MAAATTTPPRRCPGCGGRASRVHSAYRRRVVERPAGPLRMVVHLTVRRFFCDESSCPRKIFAEQIEGFTERCRRASVRLKA
ncbi:transposase family protein [Streptomyces sp. NPDC020598]|uniref:transposase family protein n=1 Tax=Streptomyces sp. NPDC020598 TaxID=3365081 RepID=UPI00379A1A49